MNIFQGHTKNLNQDLKLCMYFYLLYQQTDRAVSYINSINTRKKNNFIYLHKRKPLDADLQNSRLHLNVIEFLKNNFK